VFIFELVDEWFKKNWNTLTLDLGRKGWHNTLSSEQYFGLIATEVGGAAPRRRPAPRRMLMRARTRLAPRAPLASRCRARS